MNAEPTGVAPANYRYGVRGEAIRFTAVSGAGVIIDLALANGGHVLVGLNLYLSAALGFMVAGAASYLMHRQWTFRGSASNAGGARWGSYAATCLLILAVRYAAITAAGYFLPIPRESPIHGFLALVFAVGVSFTVNFLVCRTWVFRSRSQVQSGNQ